MNAIYRCTPLASGLILNSVRGIEPDEAEAIEGFSAMKTVPTYFVGPLAEKHKENASSSVGQQMFMTKT